MLKQLLKIYPKDTGLMTDLASAEAELSNYRGALSLYKHALSIDPHHIGAMVGVGLVSKKLGDNKTSTAFFKEAIAQPITSNDSRMIQVDKL